MFNKIQNFLHARTGRNSQVPNSVRAVSFILSVVLTTAGIGYVVAFAANTTIGNNIVTSGNLTVGGTTSFNAITYTWPAADGSAGQTLSTNGSGTLSWAAGGGSLFTDGGTTTYLTTSDKLGVGTTSATSLLSVQGNSFFSGDIINVANVTATGTITIGHTATTSAMLYVSDGTATGTPGMPGLTTAVPAWFVSNSSVPVIGLENTSVGVRMGMAAFSDDDGPHAILSTFTNHALSFEVNTGGGASEQAIWITTASKIGIGTTTPQEKLSVIGSITMTGSILPYAAPDDTALTSTVRQPAIIDGTGINAIPSGHAIALGADGFPVMAYRDATNGHLKVTKCGDSDCYTATTTTTVVSSTVGAGDQSISIAVTRDGFPVITYSEATDLTLHLIRCDNATCTTSTDTFIDGVDGGSPGPNVSTSTSVVIATDDTPRIAYYDETNGDLRFATCSGAGCLTFGTSTVDSTGDVGAFNSMAVLPDNSIIISYYDVTNGNLKTAKYKGSTGGGGVELNTVASAGDVGKFTSVAIATDGMPVISYYDLTNGNLNIAKCTDISCATAVTPLNVDGSPADIGQYSSIAIGVDGLPIVSYYDVTNNDLKMAKCLNANCSIANGDYTVSRDTDNAGQYSSVIVGIDGLPVVVYYGIGNADVKFFKCNDQNCQNLGVGYLVGGSDLGSLGKFFNNAYVESLWAKQISIKRFDLAEDYYSREALNPGEIVSLDPVEALHIKKASNDGSRVIGIVSTEPALVLSDFTAPASNDKNYPIALAGRVPVKVNSEGGSIAIGDPIALSSVSGTGKRAAEGERTIGYALDSFAGVNGTIRVFVNLNGESMSATGESSSSLLGQVIGVVKNWLGDMKVTIEDGLVTLKDMVAEKITAMTVNTINLKVGTAEAPSGITLFDKVTNMPYCVTVTDGQLQTASGECVIPTPAPAPSSDPSSDTTAPVITLSGSAIIETPRGSAWSDPGAAVVDPANGDQPANTNLSIYYKVDDVDTANGGRELPTIDTAQNGLHTITYTSTDSAGNVGTASRIVNVIDPI